MRRPNWRSDGLGPNRALGRLGCSTGGTAQGQWKRAISLTGSVALVPGGISGIGMAIAVDLAAATASIRRPRRQLAHRLAHKSVHRE
jgi:hypothetical protein